MEVVRYQKDWKQKWDEFVSGSKNATFLFYRDYMDYHGDRFQDHSLIFMDDNRIIALLPMNRKENQFISHEGLTYGGFLADEKMKQHKMNECFRLLLEYTVAQKMKEIIYKSIPVIYHKTPAEEDLYGLFINDFELYRRDVAATLIPSHNIKLPKGRKAMISRATKTNLEILLSDDYLTYFKILENRLQAKYMARPVHNADEIKALARQFPNNIKLFACYGGNEMLGGILIYESENVAHAQYIATNDEGDKLGAMDFLIHHLITAHYSEKKFIDLGKCTEKEGRWLNESLMSFKESFGGRATICDFYRKRI